MKAICCESIGHPRGIAACWARAITLWLLFAFPLAAQVWDTIPPADLQAIGLEAFDDSEIDLPYYVAHFHKIATAVEPEDPHRGFIHASVWRAAKDNQPYNARVMENIIALAFFYSQNRPWNPWYGSQQLRHRLEAALSYWIQIQGPDGSFSEYGDKQWNLAATAFATKFMGETLHYIKEGPPLNEGLIRQVVQSQRKAILAVLYGAEYYEQGKHFSNQYSNVWAGALAYLALYPDDEIRKTLETRLRSSMRDFQSPLGYFHEADGPDMGYNLRTHHSNIQMAWHYAQGTGLEPFFVDMMKDYYVWLVWNASAEKDQSGYYLNAAVNTRGNKAFLALDEGMPYRNGTPLAEIVRLARAFQLDESARAKWASAQRTRLAASWPKTPELEVGAFEAYSPYTFLHRRHTRSIVAQDLFREALTALPSTDPHPFNHIKQDQQNNLLFYYANRSGSYYLMFAGGKSIRPQQTLGITLIRSHSAGTVFLSQPGNANLAWGTRPAGSEDVYESTQISPSFRSGTQDIEVKPGANSLPEGDVVMSYSIGKGTKTITLTKDRILVEVTHPGSFVEQIPMLIPDADRVDQRRDVTSKGKFRIEHQGATAILGQEVDIEGPRKLQPLLLQGQDTLRYTIRF